MKTHDPHLSKLLASCTNEELSTLVDYLTTRTTSTLMRDKRVAEHHPDHLQYIDLIVEEIRLFGAHTITTRLNRKEVGKPYFQIVRQLLKQMGEKSFVWDIAKMEQRIVELTVDSDFDRLSKREQRRILDQFFEGKYIEGGLQNYTILDKIQSKVDADNPTVDRDKIKRAAVKQAGSFVKGKLASTAIKVVAKGLAGPIGWGMTAWQILGPAERVTIPCIWYIAYLRHKYPNQGD